MIRNQIPAAGLLILVWGFSWLLQAAEPPSPVDALVADLNARQLASIPPTAASITVTPEDAEPYEPVVVTLDTAIPDGARVYGNGWTYSKGIKALPVSSTVQHVWAKPGKHMISYAGVWVHTQKIVIVDKAGNDQTIESLLGIGMIDSASTFTVGGDPDPDPDPNPPLPPLTDLFVTILEEDQDRMKGLEGAKLNQHIFQVESYLKSLSVLHETMDDDQPAAGYYLKHLKEIPSRPAIVIRDETNQTVVTVLSFGSSVDETIAKLKKLGVK